MTTKSSLNRKVQLAFGSAIAILVVVGAFSFRTLDAATESDRWVAHSNEVLEQVQELNSGMEIISATLRGFILTGKERSHGS